MDIKKLIEGVLTDLGDGKSLGVVSAKVKIIAHLLKNDDFSRWISAELFDGYALDENIPDYRVFPIVSLKADYFTPHMGGLLTITNQVVPLGSLSKKEREYISTVKMPDSIPSIEDYIGKEGIAYSVNNYEMGLIQSVLRGCQIMRAHKEISEGSLKKIVETVKGKLIDTFMELNETVFEGNLELRSPETRAGINQVVTNNITAGIVHSGSGNIVTTNSIVGNSVSAISSIDKEQLQDLADKIESVAKDVDEEFDEIAADIVTIRSELSKEQPHLILLKNTFRAIGGWATTIGQNAVNTLVQEAIKIIIKEL